jgi:hypothetical protein
VSENPAPKIDFNHGKVFSRGPLHSRRVQGKLTVTPNAVQGLCRDSAPRENKFRRGTGEISRVASGDDSLADRPPRRRRSLGKGPREFNWKCQKMNGYLSIAAGSRNMYYRKLAIGPVLENSILLVIRPPPSLG